jgi:hypothetical protein
VHCDSTYDARHSNVWRSLELKFATWLRLDLGPYCFASGAQSAAAEATVTPGRTFEKIQAL